MSGEHRPPVRVVVNSESLLDEVCAEWLDAVGYERGPWFVYARHWSRHFVTFAALCQPGAITGYWEARLTVVKRKSVMKETGALKDLLTWCHEKALVSSAVAVPRLPAKSRKKNQGTPYRVRRRGKATEVSLEQARGIVALLPDWSTRETNRFPIRARFEVALETGLRPSTLSGLSVPRHYTKGAPEVFITADIDKAKFERSVPISAGARRALDSVCPPKGLIFGRHDYRDVLAAAAKQVLPEHLAATFTGYDLRHRAATDFAATGDLTGAAYLMGHKQVTTINRYARPEASKAAGVLRKSRDPGSSTPAAPAAPASSTPPPSAPASAASPLPSRPGGAIGGTSLGYLPQERAAQSVGGSSFGSDSGAVRRRGLEPPRLAALEPESAGTEYFQALRGKPEPLQTHQNASEDPGWGTTPGAPSVLPIAIRVLRSNALGEPISRDQALELARAALSGTVVGRLALEVLDGGARAGSALVQLAAILSADAVASMPAIDAREGK